MHHGVAAERPDESQLLESGAQGQGCPDRELVGQRDADCGIDAEDHVLVADVIEEAVRRGQAAVLVAQAAEAGQPHADNRRQAAAAEVLDDPDVGIGESFRPRRDAEGDMIQRRVAAGDRGISLDPCAPHGKLRAVELRQRGRVAEDCRGHILRHGEAHPRHAPGGRRQHVLGVRSIPLAQRRWVCNAKVNPTAKTTRMNLFFIMHPLRRRLASKRKTPAGCQRRRLNRLKHTPPRNGGFPPRHREHSIVRIPVPTVASALPEMGLEASLPLVGTFPSVGPLKPAKAVILYRVQGSGVRLG